MKLNIKLTALLFIATSTFSVFLPNSAKAFTINNGSFEAGTDPNLTLVNGVPQGFTQINSPNNNVNINDWNVSAGSVDYIGSFWKASDGFRSIDLDGVDPGTLSTIITIAAAEVNITQGIGFDLAVNGIGTKGVRVSVGSLASADYTITSTTDSPGLSGNPWTSFLYTFTPTSAGTQTLTFQSLSAAGSAQGAALDNVRVEPIPFEFSPLSLIGVGAVLFIRSKLSAKKKA
jgi:hypothetical protein